MSPNYKANRIKHRSTALVDNLYIFFCHPQQPFAGILSVDISDHFLICAITGNEIFNVQNLRILSLDLLLNKSYRM